ncbi:hypothetical protein [Marivita sp. GX14005]|uniref:hypothetical protein n=1 Tax=Marivita sp. GX14005 TaxID=2942276 RepID=UPI002018A8D4|nr:hypothetical protein [Marivita sp. GX14005]MCL3881743.1 hypothetical protein [Marivita sp. GX14005]
MLLLDRLSLVAEEPRAGQPLDTLLLGVSVALPLTRPEGIAITLGLCLLAVALRPSIWKPAICGIAAAIFAFGALVTFRMLYFGFPFPNTYYAKVSVDRLQNAIDGAKYLMSFVTAQPFAEVIVLSWLILAPVALVGVVRKATPGQRTAILASALVLGVLFTYMMLGGDHFALWRFYQPVMPILTLPFVLLSLQISRVIPLARRREAVGLGLIAAMFWIAVNAYDYRQERFRIAREFQLSHRGEVFGMFANGLAPRPSMGVVAAGGIALTYQGELRDLMGLNWVEMAHAKPVKIGFRNHASFDVDTFWAHPPDLLPQFHKPGCQREDWTEKATAKDTGVKQLFVQERFQETYSPILLERGDVCTNAFAANAWLEQINDGRVVRLGWDKVTIVP